MKTRTNAPKLSLVLIALGIVCMLGAGCNLDNSATVTVNINGGPPVGMHKISPLDRLISLLSFSREAIAAQAPTVFDSISITVYAEYDCGPDLCQETIIESAPIPIDTGIEVFSIPANRRLWFSVNATGSTTSGFGDAELDPVPEGGHAYLPITVYYSYC